MPSRLHRAVHEHIAYGETARTEGTFATYPQAARIMRQQIQEATTR